MRIEVTQAHYSIDTLHVEVPEGVDLNLLDEFLKDNWYSRTRGYEGFEDGSGHLIERADIFRINVESTGDLLIDELFQGIVESLGDADQVYLYSI